MQEIIIGLLVVVVLGLGLFIAHILSDKRGCEKRLKYLTGFLKDENKIKEKILRDAGIKELRGDVNPGDIMYLFYVYKWRKVKVMYTSNFLGLEKVSYHVRILEGSLKDLEVNVLFTYKYFISKEAYKKLINTGWFSLAGFNLMI